MKWRAGDFGAKMRTGFEGVFGILFYGPDRGQSLENLGLAAAQVAPDGDAFSVFEFDASEEKNLPSRLADEVASISFMGARKVIKVKNAPPDFDITPALRVDGADALVLVAADELSPSSRLRAAFEDSPKLAALPSYLDEGESLETLIRKTLAAEGFARIPPEVLDFIKARVGENRATTRMELAKLALYLHGQPEIALADVEKCMMDSSALSAGDLALAVADGDGKRLARILPRLLAEGFPSVQLIRLVMNHFWRLYEMSREVAGGKPPSAVVETARPIIFFKLRPSFERQLSAWNPASILRAIARLNDAEIMCKSTGRPADTIVSQLFFSLCSSARRRK
ncbi:MAG: DNA polymerase III subunit delta [Rickettsiales bacterium]|jgi:DNA polymerase-3 subunit delta|nr:DNA polymerase III subunit delta [Rickettsiales bacterium]